MCLPKPLSTLMAFTSRVADLPGGEAEKNAYAMVSPFRSTQPAPLVVLSYGVILQRGIQGLRRKDDPH